MKLKEKGKIGMRKEKEKVEKGIKEERHLRKEGEGQGEKKNMGRFKCRLE